MCEIFNASHGTKNCPIRCKFEDTATIFSNDSSVRLQCPPFASHYCNCSNNKNINCLFPLCGKRPYSEGDSMIGIRGTLVVAWVIGLMAVCWNVAAIFTTIRYVYYKKQMKKGQKIMKLLFLSLSLADLLVGVYTMAICILASSVFYRHYREKDRVWRSGNGCKALGVLFTLGSVQSVFTMLLIVFARYRAVACPYKTPLLKGIQFSLAITWVISVFVAIVPLIPQFEDYFVRYITYEGNCTFGHVRSDHVETCTKKVIERLGNQSGIDAGRRFGSWSLLNGIVEKHYPHLELRRFGYYSYHAVCIPSLFPEYKWAQDFSLVVMIVNFLSFIAMAVGYILIYRARKSTEGNIENTANVECVSSKLQIRVIIILATDLCCWMPVWIMVVAKMTGLDVKHIPFMEMALCVLPINSAINPFIYSGTPGYLWAKSRPICSRIWTMCRFCAGEFLTGLPGKRREESPKDGNSRRELATITNDRNIAEEQPQVLQTTM